MTTTQFIPHFCLGLIYYKDVYGVHSLDDDRNRNDGSSSGLKLDYCFILDTNLVIIFYFSNYIYYGLRLSNRNTWLLKLGLGFSGCLSHCVWLIFFFIHMHNFLNGFLLNGFMNLALNLYLRRLYFNLFI